VDQTYDVLRDSWRIIIICCVESSSNFLTVISCCILLQINDVALLTSSRCVRQAQSFLWVGIHHIHVN
jgi:hypothetical protein